MDDTAGRETVIEDLLAEIRFDDRGLVAAVAQAEGSGEVLMVAWMNGEAIAETLRTGRVCYWSRSREHLWRKGEISGQEQRLRELRVDCDGDALLLVVEQRGVACHTGHRRCFYRVWREGSLVETEAATVPPEALYGSARREA